MSALENFIVRDQREPGWFFVDNEIIDRYANEIGAYGVAVYCVLSRHERNKIRRVKLSTRDIGAALGISHDRVRKSLADLVNVGLIHRELPEHPAPGLISTIALLNLKVTGRHTSSSAVELDATRPHNKEEKTKTETSLLPPPPLREGGVCAIWQKVSQKLKDDLGTAYVNTARFQEDVYEKYFRDCWLVEIRDGVVFLGSSQPAMLREGLQKFSKRLSDSFRKVAGFNVRFDVSTPQPATECSPPVTSPGRGNGAAAA
jgi:hypothetical protein